MTVCLGPAEALETVQAVAGRPAVRLTAAGDGFEIPSGGDALGPLFQIADHLAATGSRRLCDVAQAHRKSTVT